MNNSMKYSEKGLLSYLYQSPGATVAVYQKLGGLKQYKFNMSSSLGPQCEISIPGAKSRHWQGHSLSGISRVNSFPFFSSFWWLLEFLGLWPHISILQSHIFKSLFTLSSHDRLPCVLHIPLPPSYQDTNDLIWEPP